MTTGSHNASSIAISEANAGRDDQVQLYQLLNFPDPLPASGGGRGGATLGHLPKVRAPAVATAASAPTSEGQGRAGKAASRRRARAASRRTPTTVLSTDAVNFRAMVQQFTGAHPTPFMAGAAAGGGGQAALGLGLRGTGPQLHWQSPVFPYGAQQEQHLHGSEERLPFSPGRRNHGSPATGGDSFLQGYLGKPQRGYTDAAPEGFLPEGVSPSQDQMMVPRAAASMGRWSNANDSLL